MGPRVHLAAGPPGPAGPAGPPAGARMEVIGPNQPQVENADPPGSVDG